MYAYILQTTILTPPKYYTGRTDNLRSRLQAHNAGLCKTTSNAGPWVYKNYFWFADRRKAIAFERYLKTGSGRAFEIDL